MTKDTYDQDKNIVVNYTPSVTGYKFMQSNADVRGIMGPVGSGKSVACVMELYRRACQQEPDQFGVRRTKFAIVRSTYPMLKSTTIPTFQEWLPQTICPISFDVPITGRMVVPMGDGTTLNATFIFLAIDRPEDTDKLKSLDVTGCWINEACQLPHSVPRDALERCGRYPAKRSGVKCTWNGLIMDTNPMPDDHWWYKEAEEIKRPTWEFFRQPGALIEKDGKWLPNPKAENTENQQLGYEYWLRMIDPTDNDYNKAMLGGQYANVSTDKAVYADAWNDEIHVSQKTLDVYKGLPLWLGWDFGLNPTVIIGQLLPNGQRRILREICGQGGLSQFIQSFVTPILRNEFSDIGKIISFADPAGSIRSETDENTCLAVLEEHKIHTEPAPGHNGLLLRLEAVKEPLGRMIKTGEPAFILDPSCKVLRRGFNGGYHFKRMQISNEHRFKETPNKNDYSHPHDALQYLMLGMCNGAVSGNLSEAGRNMGGNQQKSGIIVPQRGWN